MISKKLLEKLHLINKTFFSTSDVKKFYTGSPQGIAVILTRLVKRGYLHRIMRGYFTFYAHGVDWEEFACTVKKPSYISLESALYHHGLIDQIPEILTLVTSGKSHTLMCTGKTIQYAHIKKALYFGYEIVDNVLMATKEKALLDELYLISLKKRTLAIKPELFNELNKKILRKWLKKYPVYTQRLAAKLGW